MTVTWVGAAWAASEGIRVAGNPIYVGLYLWLAVVVLSAFSDVVDNIEIIAKNLGQHKEIVADSGTWDKEG